MLAALVIARKDLRQRFRDRSAIVLGFVAPIVVAALMSFAMGGAETFHFDLGVVDADGGHIAASVTETLASGAFDDILTVTPFDDASAASAAVDEGEVDAAIVIPAGFSAATTAADRSAALEVLTSVDAELAGDVARSIATSFVARFNTTRLAVGTAIASGASPDQLEALVARAAELPQVARIVDQPSGSKPLKGISYYGPGMAIFFVLFAIGFTARSWFAELAGGTIDRIAAAPVRPSMILAGKALSVFVYAMASLLTMAIFTSVVFDADWGPWWAIVVLNTAMATAVVALTALLIVAARTDRQADGIASVLTFGLALLGGNFTSLTVAPAILRKLSLLTPNGWALRGFTELATGVSPADALRGPLLAIASFAVVVGGGALVLSRRALLR